MTLNFNILGERLQMLRKAMGISQKELAASLNVNQVQISRVESGAGGNLELFIDLLNFYGKDFYLNLMFSDHFEPVKKSEVPSVNNIFRNIAVERLKVLQSDINDINEELVSVIGIIESES